MLSFYVLGTGSIGNSYVFTNSSTNSSLMVDCGYSYKQLKERLSAFGGDIESLSALFITHLHPDHFRAAGTIARRLGVPVFTSVNAASLGSDLLGPILRNDYLAKNIPAAQQRLIEPHEKVSVGDFTVTGFPTSHDSEGSFGYSIFIDGKKIVIITDTGVFTEEMVREASDADLLFLESNYDEEMLLTGPYPPELKARVKGERGHLSNAQAREFVDLLPPSKTRQIYFIHVSDENNHPSCITEAEEGIRGTACSSFTVCLRGEPYRGWL